MNLEARAQKIAACLREAGHIAYFAGGYVRDRLLGLDAQDIDIATDARPDQVQALFPRTVAVGAHFGVVVVMDGPAAFEVATFRADGAYIDGRRPEGVVFTTPEGDALRRDFTVNGMFFDPTTETIIDFVGGQSDLKERVLRSIGDPPERFREDKLRMLRAVRFSATLGFHIEEKTWQALGSMTAEIGVVSAERIRSELVKIFTSPGRVAGWDLLDASGLMAQILPEIEALKGCEQPPEFHPEGDVFTHTRMMLGKLEGRVSAELAFAVLLHDIAKPVCARRDDTGRIRFNGHETVGARMAEEIMRRLKFSNHSIAATAEMVRHHMAFKDAPNMRTAKLRRFMARETFGEELELHRVDCLSSHGGLDIHDFLKAKREEFANEPIIPPRLITGKDLLALGWKPGPRFRRALDEVQNRQLEGSLHSREEALAFLRSDFGESS
jgi:poly(A) polymerase